MNPEQQELWLADSVTLDDLNFVTKEIGEDQMKSHKVFLPINKSEINTSKVLLPI